MKSTIRAASSLGPATSPPSSGERRGSAAQLAARDKFAAEWGGTDGLIAKEATVGKGH